MMRAPQRRRARPIAVALAVLGLGASVLALPPTAGASRPKEPTQGSLVTDLTEREHGSVAVVGDSLTYAYWGDLPDAFAEQGWGPFAIEARSARRTTETNRIATSGLDAVRRLRANGFDPHLWIVALGTNDLFLALHDPDAVDALIDDMMDEIGSDHEVVWVNLYTVGRRDEIAVFNDRLQEATRRHDNLVIADWFSVIDPHPEWTGGDGVHPNLEGARQRNRFLAEVGFLAPETQSAQPDGWPQPRR